MVNKAIDECECEKCRENQARKKFRYILRIHGTVYEVYCCGHHFTKLQQSLGLKRKN